MKKEKILEMLNNNEIEELKKIIETEIYENSLNNGSGKDTRYKAIKKYISLKDKNNTNPCLSIPCEIEGNTYITNSYSLIKTKELFEIEYFDKTKNNFLNVQQLLNTVNKDKNLLNINLNKCLALAKSQGYKLTKSNLKESTWLLKINDIYFNLALVDMSYNIINNNTDVEIYYSTPVSPILIKNNIGECLICPIRLKSLSQNIQIIDIMEGLK